MGVTNRYIIKSIKKSIKDIYIILLRKREEREHSAPFIKELRYTNVLYTPILREVVGYSKAVYTS